MHPSEEENKMQNIHPLFVHFPIVLLLLGLLFEIGYIIFKKELYNSFAAVLLVLAAIAFVAAATTGWIAAHTVPHPDEAHELMETHETLQLTAGGITVFIALWIIFFKHKLRVLRLIVTIVAAGIMIVGAIYGGELVYNYGVGTALVNGGMVDNGSMNMDNSQSSGEGKIQQSDSTIAKGKHTYGDSLKTPSVKGHKNLNHEH